MSRTTPLLVAALATIVVSLVWPQYGLSVERPSPKKAEKQALSKLKDDEKAAEAKIEEALQQPTSMQFVETPLEDVVQFLKKLHKINIVIDRQALEDIGLEPDTPITFSAKDISFRSALGLILPVGFDWTIHHEVLLITTADEVESMLATKVYPVGDLVARNDDVEGAGCDYDTLIDAITSTVAPATWDEVGGPGSIAIVPRNNTDALVISQTYRVHHRIGKLLADLRKAAADKK